MPTYAAHHSPSIFRNAVPADPCFPVSGYTMAKNTDHLGDDISGIPASSISDAAARCSRTSSCRGFNSQGYYKRSVTPARQMLNVCLYTKIGKQQPAWWSSRPALWPPGGWWVRRTC